MRDDARPESKLTRAISTPYAVLHTPIYYLYEYYTYNTVLPYWILLPVVQMEGRVFLEHLSMEFFFIFEDFF